MLTQDNEFFWRACTEHKLVAQRCSACELLRHPPRPMCPSCGSLEWAPAELSGRGRVYSFAVLHHPQNPLFDYPVVAALVELDEGIRLVTNLVGLGAGDLRIGLDVEVRFEPTAGDWVVPVFGAPRRTVNR